MPKHRVSTSEVLSTTCPRKWVYAHHPAYNLENKSKSDSITRGLVAHAALEVAYKHVMKGGDPKECKDLAVHYLGGKLAEAITTHDINAVTVISKLTPLLTEYFSGTTHEYIITHADILGVEYTLETPLTDDIYLVGTIDLLLKFHRGEFKGETAPVDHKTTYNFWGLRAFKMNAQIPNYRYLVKHTFPDAVCSRGFINQIRWRENAVEKFNLTQIKPTKIEMEGVISDHLAVAEEIVEGKQLSREDALKRFRRRISKYNCENCSFLDLCNTELAGRDTTNLIRTQYQKNSYSYDINEES